MLLRHIATCDFRANEQTNYLLEVKKYPGLAKLGENDVVLLRSMKGDQLVFIFGFRMVNDERGRHARRFLRSEKLRLERGRWNELMVANYAEQVGIKLDGLKKLEDHLEEIAKAVAERVMRRVGGPKKPGKKKPRLIGKAA
jgi:hypothetical protein